MFRTWACAPASPSAPPRASTPICGWHSADALVPHVCPIALSPSNPEQSQIGAADWWSSSRTGVLWAHTARVLSFLAGARAYALQTSSQTLKRLLPGVMSACGPRDAASQALWPGASGRWEWSEYRRWALRLGRGCQRRKPRSTRLALAWPARCPALGRRAQLQVLGAAVWGSHASGLFSRFGVHAVRKTGVLTVTAPFPETLRSLAVSGPHTDVSSRLWSHVRPRLRFGVSPPLTLKIVTCAVFLLPTGDPPGTVGSSVRVGSRGPPREHSQGRDSGRRSRQAAVCQARDAGR